MRINARCETVKVKVATPYTTLAWRLEEIYQVVSLAPPYGTRQQSISFMQRG